MHHKVVLYGQQIITTFSGDLELAHKHVQVGDTFEILHGSSVPIVSRQGEKGVTDNVTPDSSRVELQRRACKVYG
jgi:hypothetical protein